MRIDLQEAESLVVRMLSPRLLEPSSDVVTALAFARIFVQQLNHEPAWSIISNRMLYLLEVSTLQYSCLRFTPSRLAAAALWRHAHLPWVSRRCAARQWM